MDSVTICNLSLAMLGIPAIASFEDNNNNAKLCRRMFPVLRDRCLRDHTWSFARAACNLQRLAEDSFDPEFPAVCALPGDCIRVVGLVDGLPYRRIGNRICVSTVPAAVEYIRRMEDAGEFDETFVEALQYLLAVEIGMANTRDPQLISMYRTEYERRLAIARSIDSQENAGALQPRPRKSSWLAARHGGGIRSSEPNGWTVGTEGRQE